LLSLFALLAVWAVSPPAHGAVEAQDDAGNVVRLNIPARHIVSLAPHVTELLFAAGAGERLVGVAEHSDFPPAARRLPRLGGASLDLETIVSLKPDLVVGWLSGNPPHQIARLRELGLTLYLSEPKDLEDIPRTVEHLGRLAGTEKVAGEYAAGFRRRLARLQARVFPARLRVFYQLLDSALLTVNGRHAISEAIRLCGGENIFSRLPILVPRIDPEAVLQANPEVILASGEEGAWNEWKKRWSAWPGLRAVRQGNLYYIDPDLLHRPGPRLLEGAERVCAVLDEARQKR
jgi:iron complex transport system substrate-binding protein